MDRARHVAAYAPTIFSSIVALMPYLLWDGAATLSADTVASGLSTSRFWFEFAGSLATAAYAFGALTGGDLVRRFRQKRLFLTVQSISAAGWALMVLAPDIAVLAVGQLLAAFASGALLVVALPPALRSFPAKRLPLTVFFVNFGLFGAVAAGPLVGSGIASAGSWRFVPGLVLAASLAVLLVAGRHLPDGDPKEPDRRFDGSALVLAGFGTGLPFLAVALSPRTGIFSPSVAVLLVTGLAVFALFLIRQYRDREPLAPLAPIFSTAPAVGTIVATLGGGTFITAVSVVAHYRLAEGAGPASVGLGFWPQVAGVLLSATTLALVFRTKAYLIAMAAGLGALGAALALLAIWGPGAGPSTSIALLFLGFGAGATVASGLLLAGLSLEVRLLAGAISLVEVSRAMGNFLPAPLIIAAAISLEGGPDLSYAAAIDVLLVLSAILAAGTAIAAFLFLAGGARLVKADLEGWLEDGEPAFASSPLLCAFCRRATATRHRAEATTVDEA